MESFRKDIARNCDWNLFTRHRGGTEPQTIDWLWCRDVNTSAASYNILMSSWIICGRQEMGGTIETGQAMGLLLFFVTYGILGRGKTWTWRNILHRRGNYCYRNFLKERNKNFCLENELLNCGVILTLWNIPHSKGKLRYFGLMKIFSQGCSVLKLEWTSFICILCPSVQRVPV